MATYEDLQTALVEFGEAQESYWSLLESHAVKIRDGLASYFGKAGTSTEFNGELEPYVALGKGTGNQFEPVNAVSRLPANNMALDFSVRVIIQSPANSRFKIGSCVAVRISQLKGQLNIVLGEYEEKIELAFPAEFNERHQTQLFDAIAQMIISRLDAKQFA